MLIRCGLLILFLSCVKTTENIGDGIHGVSDFSLWPSVHNGAKLMRARRQDQKISPNGKSEGDIYVRNPPESTSTTTQAPQQAENINTINTGAPKGQASNQGSKLDSKSSVKESKSEQSDPKSEQSDPKSEPSNAEARSSDKSSDLSDIKTGASDTKSGIGDTKSDLSDGKSGLSNTSVTIDSMSGLSNTTSVTNDSKSGLSDVKPIASDAILPSTVTSNNTVLHVINGTQSGSQFDFNNPGVIKRGFIVFGGFALLAVAYYIFYRRNGKNSSSNTQSLTDTNQFRYGVLQSEDKRDTELSRIPLTMETDDDDEEDLEIFDLEQKKKSLSYVNLQTNDEDVVFSLNDHEDDDGGNLLLDIDDSTSDTLINWSSSGNNKSIL